VTDVEVKTARSLLEISWVREGYIVLLFADGICLATNELQCFVDFLGAES
jgi:hypothetical protein